MKQKIDTADGEKKYVETVNDKQLDQGDYSINSGYWVIHVGGKHHVYR